MFSNNSSCGGVPNMFVTPSLLVVVSISSSCSGFVVVVVDGVGQGQNCSSGTIFLCLGSKHLAQHLIYL